MTNLNCYRREIVGGGIVVYRFASVKRPCIDEWFADVKEAFAQAKAANESIRLIYDLRAVSSPTSYALKRAYDLAKLPLPDDWYVATLCSSSFGVNFINFVRAASLASSEDFGRSRVFLKEEEALDWLRSV